MPSVRALVHDALLEQSERDRDGTIWHADVENGTMLVEELLASGRLQLVATSDCP